MVAVPASDGCRSLQELEEVVVILLIGFARDSLRGGFRKRKEMAKRWTKRKYESPKELVESNYVLLAHSFSNSVLFDIECLRELFGRDASAKELNN